MCDCCQPSIGAVVIELAGTCEVIRGELDALAGRMERVEQTASMLPEDLDALAGNERNEVYRMLRLRITPAGEDYARKGVFCTRRLLSGR